MSIFQWLALLFMIVIWMGAMFVAVALLFPRKPKYPYPRG